MYTLRTISSLKKGVQHNQSLGEHYNFIHRDSNPEEFRKNYKVVFGKSHVADSDTAANEHSTNCYGFVVGNYGKDIWPLYKKDIYYVMTESGKTFCNLTYK